MTERLRWRSCGCWRPSSNRSRAAECRRPSRISMSARAPLVSIQVPAYNAARYLPGLCQSIQAQTYPHYEVLIGDDGSSDDTLTVLAPFLKDNRFRVVRWQPN